MSSFKVTGAVGELGQAVQQQAEQFDPTAVSIPTIIPAEQIIAQQQASQPQPVDPATAAGFVRPNPATAEYVHSSVKGSDGTSSFHEHFGGEAPAQPETRSVEYGDPLDAFLYTPSTQPRVNQVEQEPPRSPYSPLMEKASEVIPAPTLQEQQQIFNQMLHQHPPVFEQAARTQAQQQAARNIPTPTSVPREASLCDTDSRYHDLTDNLPTQFVFYPFDRLSVRPLQLADHIKLGSGSKVGSARTICEGIGATIDRDWLNLAFADFIFIAFWLRVNSYQENQYSLTWMCEGREHNRKVFLGELPETTLKNTSTISKADVKVNTIDFEAIEPLAQKLSQYGIFITAPTVRDFLFFVEHSNEMPDDIAFYIDAAGVLSPSHGKTVRDRVDFLINMVNTKPEAESMEVLQLLNKVSDIVSNCGVRQAFEVACSHCGEKGVKEVEIDLLTFFPFGK